MLGMLGMLGVLVRWDDAAVAKWVALSGNMDQNLRFAPAA